jgi:hypothetical protein
VKTVLGGSLLRRQLTSQDWPQHFGSRGIVQTIVWVVVRDHDEVGMDVNEKH